LLEVIASKPRFVRYLDTPIQHGADSVLARMRRPEPQKSIRERLRLYREIVPELAIRTTVIVGFPGETDAEFETLLEFLEEMQFDRVGCFTYSPQEGTRAYDMADDVPETVKLERQERVQELQRAITSERYERFIGMRAPVLVERAGDVPGIMQGRAPWQADDIDGIVQFTTIPGVGPGALVDVTIDRIVDDYDFAASVDAITMPALAVSRAASRSLPLIAVGSGHGSSVGSYGR
jgi:ribosomal protein S12 methylthiotransferase